MKKVRIHITEETLKEKYPYSSVMDTLPDRLNLTIKMSKPLEAYRFCQKSIPTGTYYIYVTSRTN